MKRKSFDVFLSYKSVDHLWVVRLKRALEEKGLKVWLDRDQIRPGDLFVGALERGLQDSKSVALVVSPEAMASGWVREEYSRAFTFAQQRNQPLRLIPVILRDTELPGFLASRNCVDFRDEASFDKNVEMLVFGITGKKIADDIRLGLFAVPRFIDHVVRAPLLSCLHDLVKSNPVVSVEGLSGSGKASLVASYLERNALASYDIKLWHHTAEKETVNDLLAQIETEFRLTGLATVPKCKELVHILRTRNALLIIDDFHQVDQNSYATLINIAAGFGQPARIVLISRIFVDPVRSSPHIGHLEITGFTLKEMKRFLASRQVRSVDPATMTDLIGKTDGLPLAASLFCALVLRFGRDPNELLSEDMLSDERFGWWFSEVMSLIGEWESRLLHVLSVCDGPFNMSVVRKLCASEQIDYPERVFENLQRAYLVQRCSPYRWSVHQLIAMLCLSKLDAKKKRATNLVLARHYLSGLSLRKARVLNEEEFFWKIRACKQFQMAGAFRESERILQDVAKTINFRGHYELFRQLSANELRENPDRNSWIDYHHAHFCLITGRLKESLQVVEPILYGRKERDANKRVSFARLYAEIIGAMGKPQLALQKLRGAMDVIASSSVEKTVLAQARTTEVWLLTKLKRYREAKSLCDILLAESAQRDDKLGGAIALTYDGIIHHLSGSATLAYRQFRNAADLFRECGVRRGLAWSLSRLGLSQISLGDRNGAIASLKECLRIYSDTGECSIDYLEFLEWTRGKLLSPRLTRLLNAEMRRVSYALDDFRPNRGED